MKNITKIAGAAAVALTLAQSIQATPITGAIGFSGNVTWNAGANAATATQVTAWNNTQVISDSGSFSSIIPIVGATFTGMTWNLNDSASIANFWAVPGYTFMLTSSVIVAQGGNPGTTGFVVVQGVGIVSDGNSADDTTMNWSFTAQDPKTHSSPDYWTFSASTTALVPDGGSTVMLLGMALSGAALLKRKFMA
jgi:hypothetical protein